MEKSPTATGSAFGSCYIHVAAYRDILIYILKKHEIIDKVYAYVYVYVYVHACICTYVHVKHM